MAQGDHSSGQDDASRRKHARVLVVDDEANARTALAELLRDEGYDVETAADAFKALGKMDDFAPHLLLTDLKMPGMDGIALMKRVSQLHPSCAVLVMTAFGAIETAVEAMRSGAVDYLTKPLNFDELLIVTERALERQRLIADTRALRDRLADRYDFENIIGDAPIMQGVFKVVKQVATSKASVLLTGESGTGKELVASAIHQLSPRRDGPFVKLHCAALAEGLLESELFGHEKGAFTGAIARKDGRFHAAHGGTLFLDEIGEISPATQVKLLRFLQEHEFERVGGSQTIQVDVRVVAATNRNLIEEVKANRFREDLFYRLNVVTVEMPPLRSRVSDVPLLAQYFLEHYARENAKPNLSLDTEALGALQAYSWPGNVRELENAIERAVVLSQSDIISLEHLPSGVAALASVDPNAAPLIPGARLDDVERYAILKTMESTGGSTSKAAELLGISVRKIQYKLQEYNRAPKSATKAVRDDNDSH